jgi:hypothetical protein
MQMADGKTPAMNPANGTAVWLIASRYGGDIGSSFAVSGDDTSGYFQRIDHPDRPYDWLTIMPLMVC